MYGIFTSIYRKNQPNVGKYTSPMDPVGFGMLRPTKKPKRQQPALLPGPLQDCRTIFSTSVVWAAIHVLQHQCQQRHQTDSAHILYLVAG